jgi:hypothetical protein
MITSACTYSKLSNAAGVLVIPENPQREAIILTVPQGRTMFIQMGTFDQTVNGIELTQGFTSIQLARNILGDGVTATIQLTDSLGVQQTFTYIELVRVPPSL